MRLPFNSALERLDSLSADALYLNRLKVSIEIRNENSQKHQKQNKERHDAKIRLPDLSFGESVFIKVTKVPKGLYSKLYDKSDGPYRIVELGPNFTYRLLSFR